MKVLFLDVDGVLNSHQWAMRRTRLDPMPDPQKERPAFLRARSTWALDAVAVDRLNTVCKLTGCVIVLSSTWRLGKSGLNETVYMLRTCGLDMSVDVIDKTPDFAELVDRLYSAQPRGAEIQAWLATTDEWIESFAIVDDDSEMGDVRHRLVQTDPEYGLRGVDIELLVELLNENDCVDVKATA